jgi:hypothetical protein
MQTDEADGEMIGGEARMRIEGGLAHFPGRAREQSVTFDQLEAPERRELVGLARQAQFFDCTPSCASARPDARTYTVALSIDGRSRELRLAEPIGDPALARLVSVVRRLISRHGRAC